jgi:hypothetical protein
MSQKKSKDKLTLLVMRILRVNLRKARNLWPLQHNLLTKTNTKVARSQNHQFSNRSKRVNRRPNLLPRRPMLTNLSTLATTFRRNSQKPQQTNLCPKKITFLKRPSKQCLLSVKGVLNSEIMSNSVFHSTKAKASRSRAL